jgi:hypothetical protein
VPHHQQQYLESLLQVVDLESSWQSHVSVSLEACSSTQQLRYKSCGVVLVCDQQEDCTHARIKLAAANNLSASNFLSTAGANDEAGVLQAALTDLLEVNPSSWVVFAEAPKTAALPALISTLSEGGQLQSSGRSVSTTAATLVILIQAQVPGAAEMTATEFGHAFKRQLSESLQLQAGAGAHFDSALIPAFMRRIDLVAPVRRFAAPTPADL